MYNYKKKTKIDDQNLLHYTCQIKLSNHIKYVLHFLDFIYNTTLLSLNMYLICLFPFTYNINT